jgi:hypothetical protein
MALNLGDYPAGSEQLSRTRRSDWRVRGSIECPKEAAELLTRETLRHPLRGIKRR